MPQLEQIGTFPSQIFWLVITFAVLFFVVWRVATPAIAEVLESRQKRIDDNLDRAEATRQQAEETIRAYEASLDEARNNAHGLVNAATADVATKAAEEESRLAGQLQARVAESEKAIAGAREKALLAIHDTAVEVALAATEKLIGEACERSVVKKAVDDAMKAQG